MKKMILMVLLMLILLVLPAEAAPAEGENREDNPEDILFDQIDQLNTADWEPYWKTLQDQGMDIPKGKSAKDLIRKLVNGQFPFEWKDILDRIIDVFFREFRPNLMLMAKIIAIATLCGLFKNMNDSFRNPSVGEVGYFVCYSIIVILILQSLMSALEIGKTGIEQMTGFMRVLYPILLAMLTAVGNVTTSSVLQPAVGVLVGIVGTLLKDIMIPLITLSAIVHLISYISDRVQIKKLGKLLNQISVWILSFVFTIFVGVLTIQGAMTSSFDGLSVRTAKFALDQFVPVVGKMLSQSMDTIVGCSLLLKNAAGVAGLIIIGMLCLAPGMKILALMLLYKLSGALLEPITDQRIVDCLDGIGSVLNVLFITVVGIALMFFLTIALIIGTGNASLMVK